MASSFAWSPTCSLGFIKKYYPNIGFFWRLKIIFLYIFFLRPAPRKPVRPSPPSLLLKVPQATPALLRVATSEFLIVFLAQPRPEGASCLLETLRTCAYRGYSTQKRSAAWVPTLGYYFKYFRSRVSDAYVNQDFLKLK
jgi:hypothetical protein